MCSQAFPDAGIRCAATLEENRPKTDRISRVLKNNTSAISVMFGVFCSTRLEVFALPCVPLSATSKTKRAGGWKRAHEKLPNPVDQPENRESKAIRHLPSAPMWRVAYEIGRVNSNYRTSHKTQRMFPCGPALNHLTNRACRANVRLMALVSILATTLFRCEPSPHTIAATALRLAALDWGCIK